MPAPGDAESAGGAADPLVAARAHFSAVGEPAWLVGGRLRDALLGRASLDTDLAVPTDAAAHARAIAGRVGGALVALDEARDVHRVVWPRGEGGPRPTLDIARFTGPDLAADLAGRDFTVNAMAIPVDVGLPPPARAIVDPTGGLADLALRRLAVTAPEALDADPLRLVRGPRLAAELGFVLAPETRAAILARAGRAAEPASERVRDELLRLLAAPRAAASTADLDALGLLAVILPEVGALRDVPDRDGPGDVYARGLGVLAAMEHLETEVSRAGEGAGPDAHAVGGALQGFHTRLRRHLAAPLTSAYPRSVLLRLAALLREAGKAPAQGEAQGAAGALAPGHEHRGARRAMEAARRLRLGSREVQYLGRVVGHQRRPVGLAVGGASHRAVYRYFAATGDAGVDIALLALAENSAAPGGAGSQELPDVVRRLFSAWYDDHARRVDPAPVVTGNDLIAAFDLAPGPLVGSILERIREAQAAGAIHDRSGALSLARRWLKRPPASAP